MSRLHLQDMLIRLFLKGRRFCTDSRRFAFEILEHAGVGTTPGIDFGEEALERIGRFMER